ncbi:MAG: cyclic nucleotide-binding domain-containing protein [Magnetococcales bacterium]|nr:cyclic nucleotide-binding domain-containing protein [Magnetococcales bacterium]
MIVDDNTDTDDSLQKPHQFSMFQGLGLKDRQHLAERFATIHCPRGEVLLRPGQLPDYLYLVAKGRAVVEAVGSSIRNPVLAELGPGDFFPMEALFQERAVFSTFRVSEDAIFYRLSAGAFRQALQEFPGFHHYCETRSENLVDQSRKLYTSHLTTRPDYQSLDSPLMVILREKPVTHGPDAPVRQVLQDIASGQVEVSVIVTEKQAPLGLFSLTDLLHRVALPGYSLDAPVERVMNRDITPLPGKALGSQAALEMARHGLQHVVVIDEGKVIGLVGERDLFGLQRVGLAQIANTIQQASSIEKLVQCSEDVRYLSHNLLDQGVRSEQLTQIISTLNDQLTERILHLVISKATGRSEDFSFCWLALGSEGRHEQTLSSDQDNAIIFQSRQSGDVEPGAVEKTRSLLLRLARECNTVLDQCGFSLCKGEIMAGNPEWCLSLSEWEKRFEEWIATPDPKALLHSTIFFDFRPLYGDETLAAKLRSRVATSARNNHRFLHLMVENALERSPPLGVLRDFVTDSEKMIDLKLSGITLFVDAARVFSLAYGITDSGTRQRLRLGGRKKKISDKEIDAWNEAFDFLQLLRLRRQHAQLIQGKPVNNKVDPSTLNELDRRFLIESLRQAGKLQKRLQSFKIREGGF